jgi:DNA polymerase V
MTIPRCKTSVSAGNPHPLDEQLEDYVDLNREFIQHSEYTYLFTVAGDSMEDGISHGDQLLVDRSIEPTSGKIAIVNRLAHANGNLWLVPDNKKHKSLKIDKDQRCEVWGIVTYIIKKA